MKHWTWMTLGLAASMGLLAGLIATPWLVATSYITSTTSHDFNTRAAAWRWLTTPPPGGPAPRLAHWQRELEIELIANGHSDALLDAMVALESHGRFGWTSTNSALIERTIDALTQAGGEYAETARTLSSTRPRLSLTNKTGTMPIYE